MRRAVIFSLALTISAIGCKQGEGGASGGGGGGGLFGAFDSGVELKALEGGWRVKDSAFSREPSLWTIAGEKLTIQTGDKIKSGKLEVTMPGELAFVTEAGGGTSREFFAYARDGEQVYIGLGKAGLRQGERVMLRDEGLVVLEAGACKYHGKKMFGGFEAPVDVKCSLEGDVFKYEIPDRFKKGEMKAGAAKLVGNLLLDDQMQGHRAERAQP
jgi:hypothetical protein